MAKSRKSKASTAAADTAADADSSKSTKELKKVNEVDAEHKPLPRMLRMVLVFFSSIMAERAWQNRQVVTDLLYNDNQTPTQQTMISIFVYFALMGLLFLGGFLLSKATKLLARLF